MTAYFKHAIKQWFSRELGISVRVRTSGMISRKAGPEETAVDVSSVTKEENDVLLAAVNKNPLNSLPFVKGITLRQPENEDEQPCLKVDIDQKFFSWNVLSNFSKNDKLHSILQGILPKSETYVVDFSSPNIAKPFHIGHFRSTITGNLICNILSTLNQRVVRLNYLGDWGTQYGLLSLAYSRYGNEELLKDNACRHLLDIYVRINQEAEKDDSIRLEGKRLFHALETSSASDPLRRDWNNLRDMSIHHYNGLYQRLGVTFDEIHWESLYAGEPVKDVIRTLESKGRLMDGESGCKVVETKYGTVVVQKSDGSSLYLTRDVAAAIDRKKRFNFDHMLYVVDYGQTVHFRFLKEVLNAYGVYWSNQLRHVKFGRINGMSTRRGSVVLLEDVLTDAKSRAHRTLEETKSTKIPPSLFESVAETLGLSGVIVNDLKRRRKTNYDFEWELALRQSGDSGIGLQYAHARLCSLEVNSQVQSQELMSFLDSMESSGDDYDDKPEALSILISLSRFDDVLLNSFNDLEGFEMTKYLFSLSHNISRGLRELHIKHLEDRRMAIRRLAIFLAARRVLRLGLEILGLRPLEAM